MKLYGMTCSNPLLFLKSDNDNSTFQVLNLVVSCPGRSPLCEISYKEPPLVSSMPLATESCVPMIGLQENEVNSLEFRCNSPGQPLYL